MSTGRPQKLSLSVRRLTAVALLTVTWGATMSLGTHRMIGSKISWETNAGEACRAGWFGVLKDWRIDVSAAAPPAVVF